MVRQQKNEELMAAGVTLIDPATTYIDADVVVGPDTVIYPCVFLEGSTKIGAACEIHSGARIVNSTIGDRVCVRNHTVVTDSTVDAGAFLGPFAHIRPGSRVGEDAHIGNFVELKKTAHGKRRQGESPGVSRRCDDRRESQRRRRHDHLQLRRREETPDRHRRERVRRQQQHAGRAGDLGRWLVHCSRLGGHRRMCLPARLAIGRARQENKDGWVRESVEETVTKRHSTQLITVNWQLPT